MGQGLACVCVKAEEAKEPDDEALETASITPIHIVLRACFLLGFGTCQQSQATRTAAMTAAHILMNGIERRWLHMGAAATAPIILDQAQFGLDREHQLDFKSSV